VATAALYVRDPMKPKGLSDLARTKIKFIEPMYARPAQNLPQGKEWLYEVKFDGYRCLGGRSETGVTLWSRRGTVLTKQFPNIARACEQLPTNTLVDGEVVAIDETGHISFSLLQHHRSKAQALIFYVFDVLIYGSRSLAAIPLHRRRELLSETFRRRKREASAIALSESIDASPTELIPIAKEFGFEGIIAKRKDSLYESGKRTGAWLKYRIHRGQEFVIGGYVPADPFDSLIVGYYEGDKLYFVGKVRNGFVPQVRREVARRFKGLEIGSWPFANLPEKKRTLWALTREEMKNCRWLKPALVAQIEFAEWTPDGHLRHAKFVGLREDKNAADVKRET
jgi:DNA ligase D-like protein (predicted ligase)